MRRRSGQAADVVIVFRGSDQCQPQVRLTGLAAQIGGTVWYVVCAFLTAPPCGLVAPTGATRDLRVSRRAAQQREHGPRSPLHVVTFDHRWPVHSEHLSSGHLVTRPSSRRVTCGPGLWSPCAAVACGLFTLVTCALALWEHSDLSSPEDVRTAKDAPQRWVGMWCT